MKEISSWKIFQYCSPLINNMKLWLTNLIGLLWYHYCKKARGQEQTLPSFLRHPEGSSNTLPGTLSSECRELNQFYQRNVAWTGVLQREWPLRWLRLLQIGNQFLEDLSNKTRIIIANSLKRIFCSWILTQRVLNSSSFFCTWKTLITCRGFSRCFICCFCCS